MIKAPGMRARLLAVAAAALTGLCASILAPQPALAATYVPISGAGSTWSYNAIHDWIVDVNQFGMTINYANVGSTTGRSDFAQGTVDWAASEIPYGVQDGTNYDPPPKRGYAYMPDTAGGTTFMYNLMIGTQRVTNLRLSGATIAGIFTNKITMWNDPAIVADNPGLTLPAIRIIPVVRSDGSGATAEFTQWMLATQPSYWNAYCQVVGRSPCTQTSTYPVQPGSAMVGQPGDLGVSGYVSQAQANGAIGYVEFSYALETNFPVALVLNAAGYYTEPTAENVAVSLLKAQINTDKTSPLYLTQDLSQVYTDTDPRTYELSSYSYMILPTDTDNGQFTSAKGDTLGAFGNYLLCQGQQQVDQLGYSALPINLVEAGYAQLQQIPGNQVPTATSSFIQSCNNPTFSSNGTNTLADNDPQPPACDKQGPTQCSTATGGATGAPNPVSGSTSSAPASPSASSSSSNTSPSSNSSSSASSSSSSHPASSSSSSSGSSTSAGSSSSSGTTTGSTGSQAAASNTSAGTSAGGTGSGTGSGSSCDPNTGICTGSGNPAAVPNGSAAPSTGSQIVNGEPVAAPVSLGDGAQVALMALAAALLVGVGLVPPLVAHGNTRRRFRRRGPGPDLDRRDYP